VFDPLDGRNDLLPRELFRRLGDLLMLFGEIFRSEDVARIALFQEPASASDLYLRDCSCRCHFVWFLVSGFSFLVLLLPRKTRNEQRETVDTVAS